MKSNAEDDHATAEDEIEDSQKNKAVISDLIERAKRLLSELEVLRNRLRELRQEGSVELAHFRGVVSSEVGMLERLSARPSTEASAHIARSSNLPFLENVWSNAKKSKDLVALQKRIFFDRDWTDASSLRFKSVGAGEAKGKRKKKGEKDSAVIIDSITEGGRIWTKVSLVTNTRIIFDLAKQGWDSGGSDNDEGFVNFAARDEEDDRDIPLLKTAKELMKAASQVRVHTRQPTVHLILPRIELGVTAEIDEIIEDCRATGVTVFCGEDLTPEPSLEDALKMMAADPMGSFSDTINIDCTILLALVSDFSHARVTREPWFHRALQRQVEIEDNEKLLPSLLYPALGSHDMVCTEEAAKRMREIVDTIGTPSERARTALLMGDESKTRQELIDEMQQWSAYPVPEHWGLPIKIVDKNENGCQSSLPDQALAAAEEMTAINQSVFLHGWASGRTTITSNRIVVKVIEKKLDEYHELEDSVWPKIWLCPTARSLVGKEKRGGKQDEKKESDAWPLPDPLRREHRRRNGLDVLSQREGREVEDLRPNGYPSGDVIAAKLAAQSLESEGKEVKYSREAHTSAED